MRPSWRPARHARVARADPLPRRRAPSAPSSSAGLPTRRPRPPPGPGQRRQRAAQRRRVRLHPGDRPDGHGGALGAEGRSRRHGRALRAAPVEGAEEARCDALAVPLFGTSSHAEQRSTTPRCPGRAPGSSATKGRASPPTLRAAARRCCRIPQPGGGESLNVAAAAAVCLYETARQRPLIRDRLDSSREAPARSVGRRCARDETHDGHWWRNGEGGNLDDASLPTYEDVAAAAARIAGHAHRTPVLTSRTADAELGASVFFKCENFQRMGAFKFRGAYNALARFDAASAAAASSPSRRATTRRRSRSRRRCSACRR